ncbi:MAG: hypothetical protein JSR19_07600 [Proteobacteria bacterium]|nr:hypothetical protein [Pseudomonadota bacterium]HQR05064.1 hypothetical protein [Rhodocyclaceae bacterium]
MADTPSPADPLDFFRNLWSQMGTPLPGLSVPTLDVGDLEKRIKDLKAVEGWLRANLGMLQMTIQTLEMQHAALGAMQSMSQAVSTDGATSPDGSTAPWPWNLMMGMTSPPAPVKDEKKKSS